MNIKIYGADWCSDCLHAKNLLDSKEIKYEYIIITDNQEAIDLVEKINNGSHFLRLILAADTREPSNDAMACSTNTIRIDPDDALAALHFPAPSAGRAELHGKPALGQVLLGFDRVCDFVELVLRLVQGGVLARGRAVEVALLVDLRCAHRARQHLVQP